MSAKGYDNEGEIREQILNWEKRVNFHEKSMRNWRESFFFFPLGRRKPISKPTAVELAPGRWKFQQALPVPNP